MKSRIQTYGKFTIILLASLFLITMAVTAALPTAAEHIWGGYAGLLTATGSILGLTIARYGARETALSIKGGYHQEMQTKIMEAREK